MEREADEMERMTIAVASGTGIAFGGKEAYEAWESSRGKPRREPATGRDAVTARNIELARLRSMFPGSVKVN
jgi:hypothetical protein